MHHDKFHFLLNLIQLSSISNLFPLPAKNANVAKCVYYGKTGINDVSVETISLFIWLSHSLINYIKYRNPAGRFFPLTLYKETKRRDDDICQNLF